MFSTVLGFIFAVLVFALSSEAQTTWLKILGIILGVLLTLSSAINGWKAARSWEN